MQYESVNLFYEEPGQGQTPVVLLHGFPFNHTIWHPVVPYLEKEARLILPDLRGAGQSPVTEGVYTMRQMAEDVLALLDRLNLEKVILVGHSMGGYVSLAFAHAYPARLSGLGLVASQAAADIPERRQSRMKAADSVKRHGIKNMVEQMVGRLTTHPSLIEPVKEIMMSSNPVGVQGALRGMAERPDMTGELSEICVPTLIVVGDSDPILSMDHEQMMAQMLPKGWLVPIQGGGHMLMMEEPQQVADALRQLIQHSSRE